jgi:hypothetical protein
MRILEHPTIRRVGAWLKGDIRWCAVIRLKTRVQHMLPVPTRRAEQMTIRLEIAFQTPSDLSSRPISCHPNSARNTTLTARRLLFVKSNVMFFCIESAFMLSKAMAPIAPKSTVQRK